MADDRQLFALVAPRIPEIWDVIGPASLNPQPLPPMYAGLNPQPLPPVSEVFSPLNPQPLPPGPPPETYGAIVGNELLKLAWTQETLDVEQAGTGAAADRPLVEFSTDAPYLPPWLPAIETPNYAWLTRYYLGLACALAVADPDKTRSASVDSMFERAADTLRQLVTPQPAAG